MNVSEVVGEFLSWTWFICVALLIRVLLDSFFSFNKVRLFILFLLSILILTTNDFWLGSRNYFLDLASDMPSPSTFFDYINLVADIPWILLHSAVFVPYSRVANYFKPRKRILILSLSLIILISFFFSPKVMNYEGEGLMEERTCEVCKGATYREDETLYCVGIAEECRENWIR